MFLKMQKWHINWSIRKLLLWTIFSILLVRGFRLRLHLTWPTIIKIRLELESILQSILRKFIRYVYFSFKGKGFFYFPSGRYISKLNISSREPYYVYGACIRHVHKKFYANVKEFNRVSQESLVPTLEIS